MFQSMVIKRPEKSRKTVLCIGFDEEEQKQIWSRNIFLPRNTVSKESFEDMILDWDEQPYSQEEALESFEQFLAQKL